MSKGTDRTVFRRVSDKKWIDKRNAAQRGFAYDAQAQAIASGREKRWRADRQGPGRKDSQQGHAWRWERSDAAA